MKQSSAQATITIDKKYIQPGIVTAYSLIARTAVFESLAILVCNSTTSLKEIELEQLQALKRYAEKSIRTEIYFLEEPVLPTYSSLHFNETIFYKLISSSLIPTSTDIVVNFDAGILFGKLANNRLRFWFDSFIAAGKAIGCIGTNLPTHSHLQVIKTSKYPAGSVLIFDSRFQEKRKRMIQLLLAFLGANRANKAVYGEQDFIATELDDTYIHFFDHPNDYQLQFLGAHPDSDNGFQQEMISYLEFTDISLYKNPGRFKPWVEEISDVRKRPFLQARREAYNAIKLDIPLIQNSTHEGKQLDQTLLTFFSQINNIVLSR